MKELISLNNRYKYLTEQIDNLSIEAEDFETWIREDKDYDILEEKLKAIQKLKNERDRCQYKAKMIYKELKNKGKI